MSRIPATASSRARGRASAASRRSSSGPTPLAGRGRGSSRAGGQRPRSRRRLRRSWGQRSGEIAVEALREAQRVPRGGRDVRVAQRRLRVLVAAPAGVEAEADRGPGTEVVASAGELLLQEIARRRTAGPAERDEEQPAGE